MCLPSLGGKLWAVPSRILHSGTTQDNMLMSMVSANSEFVPPQPLIIGQTLLKASVYVCSGDTFTLLLHKGKKL